MSNLTLPNLNRLRVPDPRDHLRRFWGFSRPLTLVGLAMLITLLAALAGIFVDPRVITGAPAWLKPAKFAISISIYCFTLLWLLTFIRGRPRLVGLIAWVTAFALLIEMVLIAYAAALGTTSHFNVSTPVSAAVWTTMGLAVVLVWVANLLTIVLLLVQRLPYSAFAWALRLGLIVSFIGMGLAFLMTTPTPEQIQAAGVDGEMRIAGAHSVGVEDGGPGLPVTNWSTTGGDLRVAHFFGLHALQALPLFGFLVASFGPGWLRSSHRVALVWLSGLVYLGLVLLLAWQALRGQPVIAPDALTFGALLALLAASGAVASTVVIRAWRTRER